MSLLQYLVMFLYIAIVSAIVLAILGAILCGLCGLVFAGCLLIRKAIKTFKKLF